MKSIILNNPFSFQKIERDIDDSLAENEALIKIHRIGICGTDYHAYRGKQPFFSYPRVLGHELGAEVVKLGAALRNSKPETQNAKPLKIGDKVSVEPYLNCGTCQSCQNGRINCCENLQVLGVHTDGGMVEYLKMPIQKLHPSVKLSFDQLALVETLGIGAHAVQRAETRAKDLVLVIGAGPIGLSVIQFAKIAGATVAVLDTNKTRLDFAKENMNADILIEMTADFSPDILRGVLKNYLPTIIFDATGNPDSMKNAFNLVAFGGKLVFVGLFIGDVVFHDPLFHRREMTLLASRNSLPEDFKNIIQLMESGNINTAAWLTHQADFDDLPTVFDEWLNPKSGVIKAVVSL
jgi:2-desacetyl-2-hydroxyethyl bacteriochlorophyllide A dehydrogenase